MGADPDLFEQLGRLLQARLPLPDSLRHIARRCADPDQAEMLDRVRAHTESGTPLSKALRVEGADPRMLGLLEAGERGDQLPAMLLEVARQARERSLILRRVRELWAYPWFTMLLTGAVLVFVFARLAAPVLAAVRHPLEIEEPSAVERLAAALATAQPVLVWIWAAASVLFLVLVFGGRLTGPLVLRLARLAPGMRQVLAAMESARLSGMLAVATRVRFPLHKALAAAADTTVSPGMRDDLRRAAQAGAKGASPATMLEQPWIDPLVPAAFGRGDEESVSRELSRASALLHERAETEALRVERRWTIGLYVCMGLFGFVTVLLFALPYRTIIQQLTEAL